MNSSEFDSLLTELLRLEEAAQYGGLSSRRVHTLVKEGRFPRPVKVGSNMLFKRTEVEEWARTFTRYARQPKAAVSQSDSKPR